MDCTQQECKPNDIGVEEQTKNVLNHVFLLEQLKKFPRKEKPHAKTVAWPYDMEGHAKKSVEKYCELAHKKTEQSHEVSTPCLDDHNFKRDALETVGRLSNICAQIVLKRVYPSRVGRPDTLCSENKLARADTKWTRACDRRLARLTAYIHHTNDHRRYCHVGKTAQHCRLDLFQDSDFAGDIDVIKWAKAHVFVHSDSVLHVARMYDHSEANSKWNSQVKDCEQTNAYRELFGIDGELIEFDWTFSRDLHHWRFFKRSKKI